MKVSEKLGLFTKEHFEFANNIKNLFFTFDTSKYDTPQDAFEAYAKIGDDLNTHINLYANNLSNADFHLLISAEQVGVSNAPFVFKENFRAFLDFAEAETRKVLVERLLKVHEGNTTIN